MNQQHTCVCMCFIYIMYICTCWQHMLSMLCVERWIHVEHIYYEFCDCIHTYIWATLTIRPNGNWTSKVTVGALTAKTGSHTGSYLGLYIPDSIWHIQWVDEWLSRVKILVKKKACLCLVCLKVLIQLALVITFHCSFQGILHLYLQHTSKRLTHSKCTWQSISASSTWREAP